jgi:uncharacterized membrane protein
LFDGALKESGTPGAISAGGTLAALTGSLLISSLTYLLFFKKLDLVIVLLLSFSGFISSMIDSFLSAFVEPSINKISYFSDKKDTNSLTPNDLINTLASGAASLVFLILWWLFYQ